MPFDAHLIVPFVAAIVAGVEIAVDVGGVVIAADEAVVVVEMTTKSGCL